MRVFFFFFNPFLFPPFPTLFSPPDLSVRLRGDCSKARLEVFYCREVIPTSRQLQTFQHQGSSGHHHCPHPFSCGAALLLPSCTPCPGLSCPVATTEDFQVSAAGDELCALLCSSPSALPSERGEQGQGCPCRVLPWLPAPHWAPGRSPKGVRLLQSQFSVSFPAPCGTRAGTAKPLETGSVAGI